MLTDTETLFGYNLLPRTEDIKPFPGFNIWRTPRLTPEEFSNLAPEQQLEYLTICAQAAPSTHGTQPTAYSLDTEMLGISVYLDRGIYDPESDQRRVLPASDINGRQAVISVGCAIANLTTASEALGFKPELTILPINSDDVKPFNTPSATDKKYIPLAELKFTQDYQPPQEYNPRLLNAIFTRGVNRNKFAPNRPIDPLIIQQLKDLANAQGVHLTILTAQKMFDRLKITGVAELQHQADDFVVNNKTFARELGWWMIANDSHAGLGMPGDTFNLSDSETERIIRCLKGDEAFQASDLKAFADAGHAGLLTSPAVGILSTSSDTPLEWLKAGIVLEKAALLLESHTISTAFHAGLAEVELVRSMLTAALSLRGKPVVLFRAGYCDKKSPHSPRLPLNEVIIYKNKKN